MNTYKRKAIVTFVLVLGILTSCNLPTSQVNGPPDLAATITAQAQILLLPTNQAPPTQAGETALPALTPTITLTPTPTVPMVRVSEATNCRSGPSKNYDYLGALLVGETAEVVGKNTETNYWIIKNPDSSGTCWLWGYYATVSGNVAPLQEYAIPPTPTPPPTPTATFTPTLAPPAPPKNLTAAKACVPLVLPMFQYLGAITWEDDANNEDGYNVYLNGGLLLTLPPNANTAPLPGLPFPAGTPMTMGVEAFNAAGKSAMVIVVITCP
ncbi:MAG: hypothetical protein MUO77_02390 [Anaerolineales bacterium]|nr:hypothetical protein [Anaerolineales bacterium]